jgi:hypothetical protein
MADEAKAVQAIAETTGKVIDATRSAASFIAAYIDGSLEVAMEIYEDNLKYLRWQRQFE